jgi:hypothetical protein
MMGNGIGGKYDKDARNQQGISVNLPIIES